MNTSFTAVTTSGKAALYEIKSTNNHMSIVTSEDWSFLFNSHKEDSTISNSYSSGREKIYLVGEISNISELRKLLIVYDSSALSCNSARIAWMLYNFLGRDGVSLATGPYTLIVQSSSKDLLVFSDPLGLQPVNVLIKEREVWVSSELKNLRLLGKDFFDFETEEAVIKDHWRVDNYIPIKNVYRLKPGEQVSLGFDSQNYPVVERRLARQYKICENQKLSNSEILNLIDSLLTSSIINNIKNKDILIPISGGLDSSLVASISSQNVNNLKTCSIGTETSNEFYYADIVSRHIGSIHEEIVLSNSEIIDGVLQAIYLNEIFDGLSAEIQSPLFSIYKRKSNHGYTLVTGYGADLLFGGVLNAGHPQEQVNQFLWDQIYRTRWTGELSNFGAVHYGLNVRHPFWCNNLIAMCLNLDPSNKISSKEIKKCLREYAAYKDLLPESIIWRKKIGIHEGSSINSIFANIIGTEINDYKTKTAFTYQVYREIFQEGKDIKQIDVLELARNFKKNRQSISNVCYSV